MEIRTAANVDDLAIPRHSCAGICAPHFHRTGPQSVSASGCEFDFLGLGYLRQKDLTAKSPARGIELLGYREVDRGIGGPVTMNDKISVSEVKDLGDGKFSVRLEIGSPEGALSQTQTVSADGHDAAVQIAKESFSRWLKKITEYAVKNMPSRMRN